MSQQPQTSTTILAGDVGGTKTDMVLYSREDGLRNPLAEGKLSSASYESLEALVADFLCQHDIQPDVACFGVAGPVVEGRAKITNLPWTIDSARLREHLNLSSAQLLNDLEAVAYAIPALKPEDLYTVNAGKPVQSGTIGVIAPGTGLGEAFLTWEGEHYRAHASEGGHSSFAPTNADQLDMLRYLHNHHRHVSYERVCSGIGLPNIYRYLRDSKGSESPDVAAQLAEASDPTPVIVNAAITRENPCPICVQTLDMFLDILGAEAGNLALKVMATGGIYIGGGILPRILKALKSERLMQTFCNKGRFAEFLGNVPMYIILNPQAALLGAARYGLKWG